METMGTLSTLQPVSAVTGDPETTKFHTGPSVPVFLPPRVKACRGLWTPAVLAATNSGQSPSVTQTLQRESVNEASCKSQLTTLNQAPVPLSDPIKPGPVARPMTPPPHHDQKPWKEGVSEAHVLRPVS